VNIYSFLRDRCCKNLALLQRALAVDASWVSALVHGGTWGSLESKLSIPRYLLGSYPDTSGSPT